MYLESLLYQIIKRYPFTCQINSKPAKILAPNLHSCQRRTAPLRLLTLNKKLRAEVNTRSHCPLGQTPATRSFTRPLTIARSHWFNIHSGEASDGTEAFVIN